MDEPSVTKLIKEGGRLMKGLKSVVQNILVKQCGENQAGDDNVDDVIKQITRASGDDEDTDIEDADQDIEQLLENGLRSVIDLTKRPEWMSEEIFDSSLRTINPDKLISAKCKGCQMPLAAEINPSGYIRHGFDYHVHCIEKCPRYQKLNVIRECGRCQFSFLNEDSLTHHNFIVHKERDLTAVNGSHNKDTVMTRKTDTPSIITIVSKPPPPINGTSLNTSQQQACDITPMSQRSSSSRTSQVSPPPRHGYVVLKERDATAVNGSHNKDTVTKRKADTSSAVVTVPDSPPRISRTSSISSRSPTIHVIPMAQRQSTSQASQMSPPTPPPRSRSSTSNSREVSTRKSNGYIEKDSSYVHTEKESDVDVRPQVRHHKNSTATLSSLKRGAETVQISPIKAKIERPSSSLELSPRPSADQEASPLLDTVVARKKCEECLSSILVIAKTQTKQVAAEVKILVQLLIDGQLAADDFAGRVEEKFKSPPRSVWVPFLKDCLPCLRRSSIVEQLSMERIKSCSTDYDGDYRGRYEIEKILDVRTNSDGEREFLVKWLGWDRSDNTWEPESGVRYAGGKIDAFYRRQKVLNVETTSSPLIDTKPDWMPKAVYKRRDSGPPGNAINVPCPGCDQGFLCGKDDTHRSIPSFEYYVHVVKECPAYKNLNLIRKCEKCPLEFPNQRSLASHRGSHKK